MQAIANENYSGYLTKGKEYHVSQHPDEPSMYKVSFDDRGSFNVNMYKSRFTLRVASVPEHVSPLTIQVGGDHYKHFAIQPAEYCHANSIPFIEGNVIKYVSRWRNKGGVADLNKAAHMIALLIELESKKA